MRHTSIHGSYFLLFCFSFYGDTMGIGLCSFDLYKTNTYRGRITVQVRLFYLLKREEKRTGQIKKKDSLHLARTRLSISKRIEKIYTRCKTI